MKPYGIWEQIYLQCLEIRDINANADNSVGKLREHLSTIELLMPDNLEPDSNFELFVVTKLCQHIDALLSSRKELNIVDSPTR